MESIKSAILRHLRVEAACLRRRPLFAVAVADNSLLSKYGYTGRLFCTSTSTSSVAGNNPDQIMDRVISLVKKFDKIDTAKVTETADFQKDLSLDSLDRTELVMAFEQEFSIEIPDNEADKLTSCADVTKYIISATDNNSADKP